MSSRALERLREAGVTVEIEDGEVRVEPRRKLTEPLRDLLRERADEIRGALIREAAVEAFDLVPTDPETGGPKVSVRETAGRRQAEELWGRAHVPATPQHAPEVIERALREGLTEAGAYELIRRLGERISDRRKATARAPAGGTCRDCGRDLGPTSTLCGACKKGDG